jgi:hypothetical protein
MNDGMSQSWYQRKLSVIIEIHYTQRLTVNCMVIELHLAVVMDRARRARQA